MKSPSPELLERIAQDQKAEHIDAVALAKENLSFWRQRRGGIDNDMGGGRQELSRLNIGPNLNSITKSRLRRKKHLRNFLRSKPEVHALLRVGVSAKLVANYLKRPKSLIRGIVKSWARTDLPRILQERAKEDERAGA